MNYNESGILHMLREGAVIKLIGDSILAGAGASDSIKTEQLILKTKEKEYFRRIGNRSWAGLFKIYMNEKFPKCTILNNGCGGITSGEVRKNLRELYSDEDDIIIIMVGSNDRKQENGMERLFDNLTYIVKLLKERGKRVILMSPSPSTVENESYPNRLFHTEDVNNVVVCVAENEKVKLVNNYTFIMDYLLFTGKTIEDVMFEENCMNDGLHPSDRVHKLIFRNLLHSLNLGIKVDGATW